MTNPYRVRNSTRDLGTWPSREEILTLGAELDERYDVDHGDVVLVRAALARWGTPAIQPVPVAERMPGPEACDERGRCWWYLQRNVVDDPGLPNWTLDTYRANPRHWLQTHWLPHHALPVPEDCE